MYASLLAAADVWVDSLLLLGVLTAIGLLAFWVLRARPRRRVHRSGRHPYRGDADDFERLFRI